MPDIDPAALSSRPSVNLSTPTLSTKTITVQPPGSLKTSKTSQIIPARIDLEPLYTALKQAIGPEAWVVYKESTTEFLVGRLNQTEYSERIDPILASPNGEREHLHNQLIAAIYGNVTREMPDQGLAPWVSANDKPAAPVGSKPVSGDAAERRLKGDVMQLPTKDRRRIKDLASNDVGSHVIVSVSVPPSLLADNGLAQFDPHESLSNVFLDSHRRQPKPAEVPPSAGGIGGINKMNFDLEIRKRFAQPLAVESGEFPDAAVVEGRMLPFCYEAGLTSGHVQEAPHFMSVATETFIKESLAAIFSKTRSNGPGEGGTAGFGAGTQWIQTHKYRHQLVKEEDAALRGELTRDKSGLLPIESKAASERGPLGMADVRIALEMADSGLAQFPIINTAISYGYREGELENWHDYTWLPGHEPIGSKTGEAPSVKPLAAEQLSNGHVDAMDIDSESWWEGAGPQDMGALDSVLESCLAVGS
ncbi:Transcriptional co-activator [Colletotrichum higginsianum IMI 349063]|uniref:Transcriptional co-activator n=2 Tax=Colletotrichum higginsianum (strain IMI 349063) TaxID=759273 RepID=A0A1B7Y676_COLHI|nr:Transcriptional co-activator [Colletotrichum higginsianum IMI 349063]OBR07486.1 Transcriptional co-activator [Colletotrichum higginsianum IMI 349063]